MLVPPGNPVGGAAPWGVCHLIITAPAQPLHPADAMHPMVGGALGKGLEAYGN